MRPNMRTGGVYNYYNKLISHTTLPLKLESRFAFDGTPVFRRRFTKIIVELVLYIFDIQSKFIYIFD